MTSWVLWWFIILTLWQKHIIILYASRTVWKLCVKENNTTGSIILSGFLSIFHYYFLLSIDRVWVLWSIIIAVIARGCKFLIFCLWWMTHRRTEVICVRVFATEWQHITSQSSLMGAWSWNKCCICHISISTRQELISRVCSLELWYITCISKKKIN